ncbi:alpha/beta fold hydrolase [Gryllotalpicola ginsengisoli]|uniref:alpha/beta fold hydrolase n=1 Tax=Gryllotalpicola ginsengisoli TaxID=444608 RepID=UPI0003B46219|nr:alpha/beta hydrolase [Gryllotalpicola ginsengisoli]
MSLPLTAEHAYGLDEDLPEIDWAKAPEGTRAFRFAAPSGALAAWEIGDPSGERVVLVPGATGSKEDFALLAPILAGQGYFVQSYDLAGQYESAEAGPAGAEGWTYDLFESDMIAFLESGAPAHLLGFSFAGIVAELVVRDRPDLVKTLTLLASPPLAGQVFRGVKILGWLTRFWFYTARVGAAAMIWNVRTNFSKVTPERFAFANARLAHHRRESIDGMVGLMMQAPDLRAELRASGIPLLVVAGERDLWRPRRYRRFAREIGAEVAIYATGHSPCETTPHQLALDMVQLFRRVQQPAA